MRISLIIPTLNEKSNIEELLSLVYAAPGITSDFEVIVVDGGSSDGTIQKAESLGAKVIKSQIGRATQMNLGALKAKGDLLYFVHADTRPPSSFITDIQEAYNEGHSMGCYRLKFDSTKQILKVNSYFTRFEDSWSRGGDQSLFMTRDAFHGLKGFREEFVIMEEYDLLQRAKAMGFSFKIIPKDIVASARKYEENSYLRVQFANLIAFNMFRFGYEPQRILKTYRKLLNYRS